MNKLVTLDWLRMLDSQSPDVKIIGDVVDDLVDKHTVDGKTCAETSVSNESQSILIAYIKNRNHHLHQNGLCDGSVHWEVGIWEVLLS